LPKYPKRFKVMLFAYLWLEGLDGSGKRDDTRLVFVLDTYFIISKINFKQVYVNK